MAVVDPSMGRTILQSRHSVYKENYLSLYYSSGMVLTKTVLSLLVFGEI